MEPTIEKLDVKVKDGCVWQRKSPPLLDGWNLDSTGKNGKRKSKTIYILFKTKSNNYTDSISIYTINRWCYMGRFLTTICNATLLHKKSLCACNMASADDFNATFLAITCCTTLNRLQIPTTLKHGLVMRVCKTLVS